jgi:alkanesulfonate monooxygenase SsuD/methylene tetrahydromethanopterin reductase-like flavin-dependent oxidoreductase (luciferase family)
MHYGLDFPPFGALADPRRAVEVAVAAEQSGWDGVFVWDHLQYRAPVTEATDPWIPLAAIAQATERVRIGPMVTPLARRRPQVVARQTAALDQLSGGRLILGVGLGLDGSGRELSAFGEELDDRVRAEMLDESLGLLTALWSGDRVIHRGRHYRADDVRFLPTPVTRPRPPIWVAGRWPYRRPLRRAAGWDGIFLIGQQSPDQLAEAAGIIAAERGDLDGFDIVVNTPYGDDPRPWDAAGATWWLTESAYDVGLDEVMAAARGGPPR